LKKQLIRLLRWILFLWVRVEVFPQPDPTATLDSTRPVLYVLADRGLSDLLVLTQVTQRHGLPDPLTRMPIAELKRHHSVYSIASRNPVTDWIKRRRKHSPMLTEFMQAFSGFLGPPASALQALAASPVRGHLVPGRAHAPLFHHSHPRPQRAPDLLAGDRFSRSPQ